MELIYEAQSALAGIGVEMGNRSFRRGGEFTVGSPESIYRMMHPLDGCTVVAPAEWADELFVDLLPREVTNTPHRREKDPKYMIVDLYRENPFLTKEEFREQLYPEMPRRQFNKHWQYAADIEPNIQKPGRRKAQS